MKSPASDIFGNSGPIAKALPNYELREEQVSMAEAVYGAIHNSETLIVEAGTGVGKSFAYLLPVAEHVLENEALAIVSTNTISLQEQLIHKDIPFLERSLNKDFKAVLVKGRHNYLCLRRLDRTNFKQKDLFEDENDFRWFAKIVAWSYKTIDGSLYDLDEEPPLKIWDMVSSNTENCLGKKCPYYKKCFFQKARERINDSRILIVNHHLFFSNLAIQGEKRLSDNPFFCHCERPKGAKQSQKRDCFGTSCLAMTIIGQPQKEKSILPEYDVLVFDEAHSIENVATDHLGAGITSSGLRYLMDQLFNARKQKGFLFTIGDEGSMEWVELIRKRSDAFFEEASRYFQSSDLRSKESDTLRLRKPNFIEDTLSEPLTKLVASLSDAKAQARDDDDELEITSYIRKLNALSNSLNIIMNQTLTDYVYWIECSNRMPLNRISINAAPINVGKILKEVLFSSYKPIILTSATLSIDNGSFSYFKNRVGIGNAKELKLGSPFDYRKQVKMYIVKDMPYPNDTVEYANALSESIKKYIELTNGRAFVLFTNYSLMDMVYSQLEDFLYVKGYNVLKQGSGLGRSKMLTSFKSKANSVLFGVDSFWQGIDVQGETLSNVIITKLPFSVPDNPIVSARIEEIEKQGKDAFLEYNLPEAVLKFKQGFGRLIRSKQDTGIVAVLDSRIIKKSYGRSFLKSIPQCEFIVEKREVKNNEKIFDKV